MTAPFRPDWLEFVRPEALGGRVPRLPTLRRSASTRAEATRHAPSWEREAVARQPSFLDRVGESVARIGKTVVEHPVRTIADLTPGVGDVLAVKDAADAVRGGNLPLAGLALASIIPGIPSARRAIPARPMSVLHNLYSPGVLPMLELGGVPSPSLALLREDLDFDQFGDVTLVGTRELGDPAVEPFYAGDIYSERQPRPEYPKLRAAQMGQVRDLMRGFDRWKAYDDTIGPEIDQYLWAGGTPNFAKAAERIGASPAAWARFLESRGVAIPEPAYREVTAKTPRSEIVRTVPKGSVDPETLRGVGDWMREEAITVNDFARSTGQRKETVLELAADDFADWLEGHAPEFTGDLEKAMYAWMKEANVDISAATRRRLGRLFAENEETLYGLIGAPKRALDPWATRDALQPVIDAHGGRAAVEAWARDDLLRPLMGAPHVTVGRKRMPYTLENVTAAMKRRGVRAQEAGITFSEGQATARQLPKLRDVEEARTLADQRQRPRDEVEAARRDAGVAPHNFRGAVAAYWSGDRDGLGHLWDAYDAAMRGLSRLGQKRPTRAQLRSVLRREGFRDVPDDVLDLGLEALAGMRAVPVPYFEGKPQRAVRAREFPGALIPAETEATLRGPLEAQGMRVRTYSGRADRKAALDALRRELAEEGHETLFTLGPLVAMGLLAKLGLTLEDAEEL